MSEDGFDPLAVGQWAILGIVSFAFVFTVVAWRQPIEELAVELKCIEEAFERTQVATEDAAWTELAEALAADAASPCVLCAGPAPTPTRYLVDNSTDPDGCDRWRLVHDSTERGAWDSWSLAIGTQQSGGAEARTERARADEPDSRSACLFCDAAAATLAQCLPDTSTERGRCDPSHVGPPCSEASDFHLLFPLTVPPIRCEHGSTTPSAQSGQSRLRWLTITESAAERIAAMGIPRADTHATQGSREARETRRRLPATYDLDHLLAQESMGLVYAPTPADLEKTVTLRIALREREPSSSGTRPPPPDAVVRLLGAFPLCDTAKDVLEAEQKLDKAHTALVCAERHEKQSSSERQGAHAVWERDRQYRGPGSSRVRMAARTRAHADWHMGEVEAARKEAEGNLTEALAAWGDHEFLLRTEFERLRNAEESWSSYPCLEPGKSPAALAVAYETCDDSPRGAEREPRFVAVESWTRRIRTESPANWSETRQLAARAEVWEAIKMLDPNDAERYVTEKRAERLFDPELSGVKIPRAMYFELGPWLYSLWSFMLLLLIALLRFSTESPDYSKHAALKHVWSRIIITLVVAASASPFGAIWCNSVAAGAEPTAPHRADDCASSATGVVAKWTNMPIRDLLSQPASNSIEIPLRGAWPWVTGVSLLAFAVLTIAPLPLKRQRVAAQKAPNARKLRGGVRRRPRYKRQRRRPT